MFRVIWQYGTARMGAVDSEHVATEPLALGSADKLTEGISLVGTPEPVFRRPPLALRAEMLAMPAAFRAQPGNDLAGYHHAFTSEMASAERLKERLLNEPDVIYAEIQGRPTPPFIVDEERRRRHRMADLEVPTLSLHPAPTASFEPLQGYLDAAPEGIDARFAWSKPGGRGACIRIVDVESGWNFGHEDLIEKQIGVIYGLSSDGDHGTAVLGIYSGDQNGIGVTGIAAEAIAGAASATYDWTQKKWNAADAIRHSADALRAGDVILLEMHAPGPNSSSPPVGQEGFIPIEYWQSEFAAVQYAVARGVHVVEAAGNGGENLDAAVYGGLLSRAKRDSGAILVGGGASPLDSDARSRMWWSNYGSRLDVQGWGEDIVTTGGRERPVYHDLVDHPEASRCYTQSFGGTSGASPIVTGVVACINGCLKAAGRPILTPIEMRKLLTQTGTPQTAGPGSPATENIGPLPDLKKALERLEL